MLIHKQLDIYGYKLRTIEDENP